MSGSSTLTLKSGSSTLTLKSALKSPKVLIWVPIDGCMRATKVTENFVAPLLHPKPRSVSGILRYAVRMKEIPETGLRLGKIGPRFDQAL
jgi:hypothetical protein